MTLYYWDTYTDRRILNQLIDLPSKDSTSEEIDFWRRISKLYGDYTSLNSTDGESQFLTHSLRSELLEIRSLTHLRNVFKNNPYQTGLIEALFLEAMQKNIYALDAIEGIEKGNLEVLKIKIIDFIGKFLQVIHETDPDKTSIYIGFAKTLKDKINRLTIDKFVNLRLGYQEEIVSIDWKGSETQLVQLYKLLQEPVEEGNKEIYFIKKSVPLKAFSNIFKGTTPLIKWSETSDKNDIPTCGSLNLLFNTLKEKDLITRAPSHVIKSFLEAHFFNKTNGTLSNRDYIVSSDTNRARRILEIVETLCEAP